jgi:hypothetical protein
MQGVKDSTGAWVIQPKYDDISVYHERYIVSSGGKMGLIDYNGKEMIPLMYDYLRPANSWSGMSYILGGYYAVSKGAYTGIVDSTNHIVVPIHYLNVRALYDSTFCCQLSKKTYDLYNLQGTCFHIPWKSRRAPDMEARHAYVIRKRTLLGYRYGVVDDSAHIILERKYDDISGYYETSTLYAERKHSYGFCTLDGKWLWNMNLSVDASDWYADSYYHMPGNYEIGPAFSRGRWGLISVYGDTVLPFVYDEIEPLQGYGANDLWKITVDTLEGVYDTKHGWVLRPESTVLTTVETFQTSDSTNVALLVAQQNGKWGALTTSGQTILPFRFDDMLQLTEDNFIFRDGDSLYALNTVGSYERNLLIEKATGKEDLIRFYDNFDYTGEKLRAIPDSKTFSVYHGDKGTIAFFDPSLTHDSAYVDSVTVKSLSTGNKYGMVVPDSILISALFFVQPFTEANIHTKMFDVYSPTDLSDDDSAIHYNSFVLMHDKREPALTSVSDQIYQPGGGYDYLITGHDDLIKTDGTIICSGDSVYEINYDHHGNDGSLFFTVRNQKGTCALDSAGKMVLPYTNDDIGDFTEKYSWRSSEDKYYSWYLFNNRTHRQVTGKKVFSEDPFTIWDSITIIKNDQSGSRIFNADRNKYLTSYGFNSVIPLNTEGTLFAVKTCSEHVGVMNASGKYILDTIYEAFTRVDSDTFFRSNESVTDEYFRSFFHRIVFYNATSSVTLDCTTGTTLSRKESLDLLWKETAVVLPYENLEATMRDSFTEVIRDDRFLTVYMNEKDSASLLSWHKQSLMDTIYTPVRYFDVSSWYYQNPCIYCKNSGVKSVAFDWEKNYGRNNLWFMMEYHNDSLLSFSRVSRFYSWQAQFEKKWFSTVMLFPDGPHQMTLDSLFNPSSDWKNFVINTVISYVNTHMGIEGDCHNPAGLPSLLNEQFLISEKGLLLYPPDFKENSAQLVLTIPWKELDPYLRNDIRNQLPVSK